jgi:hypothetical protein
MHRDYSFNEVQATMSFSLFCHLLFSLADYKLHHLKNFKNIELVGCVLKLANFHTLHTLC